MIRHEYGNWIPAANMLFENEDGNIIAAFLTHLRHWSGKKRGWRRHYFITDHLPSDQRTIGLVFEDLTEDASVEHFLCCTYSERSNTSNMAGVQCKEVKSHLGAAF